MSKKSLPADLVIQQLPEDAPPPMDLLLMADPHEEEVQHYIKCSIILQALIKGKPVGVLALTPETKQVAEIRNIAVAPEWREKGIAGQLLKDAAALATRLGYNTLQVCTGNSSIRPFQVYQQYGFGLTDVRWNHFTLHYPEPIIEDGIVCRHQLVLTKQL